MGEMLIKLRGGRGDGLELLSCDDMLCEIMSYKNERQGPIMEHVLYRITDEYEPGHRGTCRIFQFIEGVDDSAGSREKVRNWRYGQRSCNQGAMALAKEPQ